MAVYGLPEYLNEDFAIPTAKTPRDTGELKNIAKRQREIATQFRANIPKYAQQLQDQYEGSSRRGLASSIRDTRREYNRRGLLRSGMRQGAEYGKQASHAQELANQRYGINQMLEGSAQELEGNAMGTGLQQGSSGLGLGSAALSPVSNSLAAEIARAKVASTYGTGIMQGGFAGLGYALGR